MVTRYILTPNVVSFTGRTFTGAPFFVIFASNTTNTRTHANIDHHCGDIVHRIHCKCNCHFWHSSQYFGYILFIQPTQRWLRVGITENDAKHFGPKLQDLAQLPVVYCTFFYLDILTGTGATDVILVAPFLFIDR